jgi:hypothetical protein
MICNFAIENNMIVMSTQFQHKTIHKGTWISPELTTVNQVDNILINANKKKTVQDIRTLRGLNCDSDHLLVKTIIKQRLITMPRRNIENRKKWNLGNIKNPLKLRQYRQKIHEKLPQKMEQADVNHEWESIKSVLLELAEETIKTREKYIRNEWWDEECRAAISRKNITRKKYLHKTRANQEQYMQARKEASKICKEKKNQWLNNRIKQVEEAHKQNETRKFFKDIRIFQNNSSPAIFTCKGENGILKTDKQEVLDRWKQYFADLMKTDRKIGNQAQEEGTSEKKIEVEPPTYKEVSDIIKKLKENKAPGTDNIPAELIKCGGYILKHRMYKLILLIWNKEQSPTEWLQGIICPIYKKGEQTIHSNYRPIMLLDIPYTIFTIILNNRLPEIVESKLSDVQSGFRPNRSTLDNIFIVRQTCEKCYKYNINLHNIFVDYIQAFDSVNRNKVIDSLNQYDIRSKLKKLIVFLGETSPLCYDKE